MAAISLCKKIIKEKGIKLKFKKLENCSSYYDDIKKEIIIDKEFKLNTKVSAFFHELGHVHCLENGLWDKYHSDPPDMKTALRAEVWIDDWAQKEFEKYFPNGYYGPYDRFYRFNDESRKFLKNFTEKHCYEKEIT